MVLNGTSTTPSGKSGMRRLADYRKIHGHRNVRINTAKTPSWFWVAKRAITGCRKEERSRMTLSRIQELESLGFRIDLRHVTWEDRLSEELADYRKINGHCNVPCQHGENTQPQWVSRQRLPGCTEQERSRRLPHSRALKRLGFECDAYNTYSRGEKYKYLGASGNVVLSTVRGSYHGPAGKGSEDLAEVAILAGLKSGWTGVCGGVSHGIAIVRATHMCLRVLVSFQSNEEPPSPMGSTRQA
jgi:hypothetical protein